MTQRDLAKSANNTRPAKVPALNVPRGLDDEMRNLLEAMKERLELREGTRGNPFERALTLRDVDLLKPAAVQNNTTTAEPAPSPSPSPITSDGITEARVQELVANALSIESNSLRAEIATLEREFFGSPDQAAASVTGEERKPMGFSGNATFYGTLNVDGLARFAGRKSAGGAPVRVGAATYLVEYSSFSDAASDAGAGNVRAGAVGYANANVSFRNVGVLGKGVGVGKGIGVVGDGDEIGGYFISGGSVGLVGVHTAGGVGVECNGTLKFGDYTYPKPDGTSTTQFMCRNGTWSVPSQTSFTGPTTGTGTANFISTNKPGGTSGNAWLVLVQNGTTYYLPAWT